MLFIQERKSEQTGSGEIILTWTGPVEEQPGFPERVSTEQNVLVGSQPEKERKHFRQRSSRHRVIKQL